jgi:hypothetical protein
VTAVGEERGRGVGVDAADVGAIGAVGELGAGSHRGCACVGHAWWWICGQREGSYGDATEIKGKHNTLSGWFI